jgi:hypothetical protein
MSNARSPKNDASAISQPKHSSKSDAAIEQPIQPCGAANQAAGSPREREVMTDPQGETRPSVETDREYDENLDDPADLPGVLAVLDAAVRDALPQIQAGTAAGTSLRKVHDAALRVISAAHIPRVREATLFDYVCEAIDRLAEKLTISGGGTEDAPRTGAVTAPPRKPPAWSPVATGREYDQNVDHPKDILDLMAVLDAAARNAHPQFLAGTADDATLAAVHDAALRVIGAARNPSSAGDRGFTYLKTLCEHVFEAMDRLVESRLGEDDQ